MSNNENFGTNEENKVSVNKTINNNENKPATSKESVIKKTIVKDTATPAPIKIKQKKQIQRIN